jgi:hypothetical protein
MFYMRSTKDFNWNRAKYEATLIAFLIAAAVLVLFAGWQYTQFSPLQRYWMSRFFSSSWHEDSTSSYRILAVSQPGKEDAWVTENDVEPGATRVGIETVPFRLTLKDPYAKSAIFATPEQRRETLRLHNEMYSTDFYSQVLLPVWSVCCKWKVLERDEKEKYRADVVNGFRRDAHPLVPSSSSGDCDCLGSVDFYHDKGLKKGSSEHVALVRFLHFFSNLMEYIDLRIVDQYLVARLFGRMYGYYRPFIEELRFEIKKAEADKPNTFPEELEWRTRTIELEELFDRELTKQPVN